MSTILRALRQLQRDREQQDDDSLRGRTSWRPPKRRRVPWLWLAVALLAVGGTGWLVVVGPSPLALLEDTIQVASNAADGVMSSAKPAPEKRTRAAKPRAATSEKQQQAQTRPKRAEARKRTRPAPAPAAAPAKSAALAVPAAPLRMAQAEPPKSAAPTGQQEEAGASTPDEAQESKPPPAVPPKPPPVAEPAAEPKPKSPPAQKSPPEPAAKPVARPKPKPAAEPKAPPRKAEAKPATPTPAVERASPVRAAAERAESVSRDGFPRVLVTRVRWHPDPARREARVELDQAGPFDAREGDIIAGVMVRRIEPAAVEVSVGGKRALVSISR